ncbi:Arf GTPase activating protein [Phytophthora cactorum]|nr:Arf GTPase activating protein [Phytophthora cactorum]
MAKASPSEKRQEERLIQELRDFQRSNPSNKRCFDCNEMMPQYVCLDFNTFVCTACSGIHREFAHRVKSISMSKFTESEVKNMINHGGNEAAQKYWRSKHDPSFRPNGGSDGERTRNFIRLTYIDRKLLKAWANFLWDFRWVFESPRHSKDEEPEGTSSKSSKKKEKKADSDDDFFSSSSKSAKANADSGFADFSNFEGSSRTAAAATESFGDFGNFATPASTKKNDDGFADFGDFSGSSSTAQKATPKAAPRPPAPKFDSFKIAPPPGSHFSSASVSSPPATNDLMGLSPPKKAMTTSPASGAQNHPISAASSPFNAFDASTPTSRAGSRSNSAASLDPFSDMAAATPSAPAPAKQNASPFDAFGSPSAASPSSLDAFAAPSPASTAGSNVFDAFGGGGDAFGDFTGSTSSSRTNSANPVLDPFASRPDKPTAASTADPFAAFDGMQSSSGATPASNNAAPTPDFGFPGGNNSSQQQAAMNDPFGFASGASNNNSGFPAAQQQPVHNANNQAFGGFPGGFPQQQQPPNAFGGQVQQQPMQPFHQGQPPQHQHPQQWYGQQQGFPGQQQSMHPTGQQYPGQFPPRPAGGAPPAPIPVKTPASVTSINDPFASLNLGNLGFGSSNSNTTAARTGSGGATGSAPFAPPNRAGSSNSFGNAPPAPGSSGSFSYAQPQARVTSSFTHPPQNSSGSGDPNVYVTLSLFRPWPFARVDCIAFLVATQVWRLRERASSHADTGFSS